MWPVCGLTLSKLRDSRGRYFSVAMADSSQQIMQWLCNRIGKGSMQLTKTAESGHYGNNVTLMESRKDRPHKFLR